MSNSSGNKLLKELIFAWLGQSFQSNITLGNGQNDSDSGFILSNGITPVNDTVYKIPVVTRIYVWTITCASIIGIIGNLLVLIVYLRNFRSITPFKFLISHLAFCDFLFSFAQIFDVAANGLYTPRRYYWRFNSSLCKLTKSSVHLSSLVSVGTILAITVERFQGIRQGLLISSRSNIWKKVLAGVCLTWMIAVPSEIPIFMSAKLVDNTCREQSKESLREGWTKMYSIYLLLVFCLIPMVAIAMMNGMVIFEIKRPGRSNSLYRNMGENIAKQRKRRDIRVMKILVSIILAFFVCVFPIRLMFVVSSFFDLVSLKGTDTWKIVSAGYLSYPLHVAANPVVYSIIDKAFRKELVRILRCCNCKVTESNTSDFTSGSGSFTTSFKLFLCHKENQSERKDLLPVPVNSKPTSLLSEEDTKVEEQTTCFHRETCI